MFGAGDRRNCVWLACVVASSSAFQELNFLTSIDMLELDQANRPEVLRSHFASFWTEAEHQGMFTGAAVDKGVLHSRRLNLNRLLLVLLSKTLLTLDHWFLGLVFLREARLMCGKTMSRVHLYERKPRET
jgi:hypothetical protein